MATKKKATLEPRVLYAGWGIPVSRDKIKEITPGVVLVNLSSTSCVGDSRAKTSAGPAEGRASRAPAPGSGMNSTVSCTSCSQPILLSKMSRREKDAGCPLCAECLSLLITEHAPSKFLQQMSVPPHLRERVFVLAVADPYCANIRKQSGGSRGKSGSEEAIAQWLGASVDYAHSVRQPQCSRDEPKRRGRIVDTSQTLGDPQSPGCAQLWGAAEPNRAGPARESECQLGRVPDGIPHRLDLPAWWPFGQGDMQDPREPSRTIGKGVDRFRNRRLKALGNAVVPHCAYVAGLVLQEWIRELEVSAHG